MEYLLTWEIKVTIVQKWIIFNTIKKLDLGSVSKVIHCDVDSIEEEIIKSKEKVLNEFESNNADFVAITLIHIVPLR